jgi:4-amino-4-deoxy-L-arabinose transferase-like glycosyltransferase
MARSSRGRVVWLFVAATLLFFFLALDSLAGDSPTMDEQNHLARGLALLRTGDARLSLEHPPLVNVLSALPLLTLGDAIRLPTDHPSWEQPEGWYAFADQLLWVANADVTRMIFLARLPIVFLTLGLGVAGYQAGRRLWESRAAGAFAMLFLLFDPNIIAHGRYSTTDLGGCFFLFVAAMALWWLWAPGGSWWRAVVAGVALGLAFASKLSTLSFVPIFGLLALLPLRGWPGRGQQAAERLARLLAAGVISLAVVWAAFAFEMRPYYFRSDPLLGLNGLRGPMATFWAGIEQILSLSGGGRPSFLLGRFSTEGFLAYFPVALAVKTPPAGLILLPLAAVILLGFSQTRRCALFLSLPAALFFVISLQSGLNLGYRHLLPALPFLYLLMAGLAGLRNKGIAGPLWLPLWARQRPYSVLLAGAFLSVLTADLVIHPHYLSYFNSYAGGPANGRNILVDSNIDWGQDLLRLRSWMGENGVERVKLAWFGTARPAYYGIEYEPLPGLPYHFDLWWDLPFDPAAPEPGVYAISVSNLWELPLEDKHVFPWFRAREPDDSIGYSILIYRVP